MKKKAIIFGIKGLSLSKKEKFFFKKIKPWGIILFSRNIKNIQQLKELVQSIREMFKDKKYPILIDQEGGSVSRLNDLIDFSLFSQKLFGDFFYNNRKLLFIYYQIYINTVCNILKTVGININTVPVLDVKRRSTHKIIGSRSFSKNPLIVSKLGNLCIKLHNQNKIATVVKHIPGHGQSTKDTHHNLGIISSKKKELKNKDFKPFKSCKTFFAMTAHLIYSNYDCHNTATHSKKVIKNIIRKYIGFKGILISDDISMKALKYDLKTNAIKALNSGCNLVLHCNANMSQMEKLAKIIPSIDTFTKKKTSDFYKFLR